MRSDFDQRLVLETLVGVTLVRNFLTKEPTHREALDQLVDVIIRGIGTS